MSIQKMLVTAKQELQASINRDDVLVAKLQALEGKAFDEFLASYSGEHLAEYCIMAGKASEYYRWAE